jgi:hypothetical protein
MPVNPTGESAASHEGAYLELDERDDEVLTMTRRDLRVLTNQMLKLALKRHVRLDTITPKELAR